MNRDPITDQPLPANTIQRVLFIASDCHIYRIPPPSSPRYLTAALWTANPADNFFTGRLRVIETALPSTASADDEKVTATILIEDSNTGDLFAAAPYNHVTVVTQATDSSRFFAIRVVGEGGMKATLGLGFEERPIASDFSIALQDVRRTLGLDASLTQSGSSGGRSSKSTGTGSNTSKQQQQQQQEEVKRDLSLKEGEMITIKIGGKGRRVLPQNQEDPKAATGDPFAIAPPPGPAQPITSSTSPILLSPPPSSPLSTAASANAHADDDGFDDGEFGEFQ